MRYFNITILLITLMPIACSSRLGSDKSGPSTTRKMVENPDIAPDPKAIKVLGGGYSRDAKHVFYRNNILKADDGYFADPSEFQLMGEDNEIGLDTNRVFMRGNEIVGADPASFEILIDGWYYKDFQKIFYMWEELEADAASFEILSENFPLIMGKDKDRVYYYKDSVEVVSTNQITFFDYGYWADGTKVYFKEQLVEEADLATFSTDSNIMSERGCNYVSYGLAESPPEPPKIGTDENLCFFDGKPGEQLK